MSEQPEIATLPPIAELRADVPRSPRTGEPRRPAVVLASALLQYLAVTALAVAYGLHWWAAAHPETYPLSARLVEWLEPAPGTWQSLTIEGGLAGGLVLAAGACGVVGFHAWNGWRWTRWGAGVALVLAAAFAALLNDWAFVGVALSLAAGALVLLPAAGTYFQRWERVRGEAPPPYRRPARIVYGRLPRFR